MLISGVAITHATDGKSGRGEISAPRPKPKTVPPSRKSGKSEPTTAAIRNFSAPESFFLKMRSRASSAAVALPEPPPSPPWTGSFLSISITTRPFALSAAMAGSTIR